jgi:hypothetical protein
VDVAPVIFQPPAPAMPIFTAARSPLEGPGDTTLVTPNAPLAAGLLLGPALLGSEPSQPAASGQADGAGRGPAAPGGDLFFGTGAASAGASGSGSSHGFFIALLLALGGLAALLCERLRLAPARWRPAAFIALLERPG